MPERLSGIGVYTRELYKALVGKGADIVPVTKLSRAFKPSYVENHIGTTSRPFLGAIESLRRPAILQGPDFRLLSYSPRFKKIVTIHDLAVFHPGFNAESFREKGQHATLEVIYKGKPDIIVADTMFVAGELSEKFPEYAERVKCIPAGSDHFIGGSVNTSSAAQKKPYFLYAGHLETRKNIIGIVKGFEYVAQRHPYARLYLVGKDGFETERIRKVVEASPARKAIELRGFIATDELRTLYSEASAFVFPSFYEGFGFPILEAMSLGCPVITSDRGAMSELAGDAALLVAPENHEQIGAAMELLLTDPEIARSYVLKGMQRCRLFTWENSAAAFVDLYSTFL